MTNTAKTTGTAIFLTTLTVALAASLVMATDVYLLIFLAVLFAVLISNLAKQLGTITTLAYKSNLAIVVATFLVLSVGTFVMFSVRIEQQIDKTSEHLDQSYSEVQDWLSDHGTVRAAMRRVPLLREFVLEQRDRESSHTSQESNASSKASSDETRKDANTSDSVSNSTSTGWSNVAGIGSMPGKLFGLIGEVFSTTFGAVMNVAFVLFVGVFLAMKPHFYRDNVAILFPPAKRARIKEVLDDVGDNLFNWLQGRGATMLITGVGTGLMLWLLGVPLAFTLGVITGVLTFIPNIGAICALLLAMLMTVSQGSSTVMWVVVVYGVLQFVESNVITPLIQQRQTSVPPPLLLSAQLMMGVLTGFLGVLVATPMLAALIVLVKELYVVDVLENP